MYDEDGERGDGADVLLGGLTTSASAADNDKFRVMLNNDEAGPEQQVTKGSQTKWPLFSSTM